MRAAQKHAAEQRVPFHVQGQRAGTVARVHLQALQDWVASNAALQQAQQAAQLQIIAEGVRLEGSSWACQRLMDGLNASLRQLGLISGWRDEPIDMPALDTGKLLLRTERAAARFWGSLTLGAHATGYLADADGQPTQVWVAQRANNKATDPGLWDNLIGGGVPAAQSPFDALVREGWEEAGLAPTVVTTARQVSTLQLLRDVPAGLQRETLHSFDLRLHPGQQPLNQDGEVQCFRLLPLREAVELAQSAKMTLDAALVMLDFANRHGWSQQA